MDIMQVITIQGREGGLYLTFLKKIKSSLQRGNRIGSGMDIALYLYTIHIL